MESTNCSSCAVNSLCNALGSICRSVYIVELIGGEETACKGECWCCVAGRSDDAKENCCSASGGVTYDCNGNVLLLLLSQHTPPPHHQPASSQSAQHPPSVAVKRKSSSIFSSVEQLARGTTSIIQHPSTLIHAPTTPASRTLHTAQRSPAPGSLHTAFTFDLSVTDSGLGDSAVRDITSALDRTPEARSDDVIKMAAADFGPSAFKPVVTTSAVATLRHRSISVSGAGAAAAAASGTRANEKPTPPEVAFSTVSAVGKGTVSSRNSLQQIGGGNPPDTRSGGSPQSDETNCVGNGEKLDVIHDGHAIRNPLVTRAGSGSGGGSSPVSTLQLGSSDERGKSRI